MSVYDIPVRGIDGTEQTLGPYRGSVLLIVNVASKCGFTGQYEGLEALHRKFQGRGFAVLGFPCNQFLGQEPGTDADIRQFCTLNYRVSFPLFAKIDVNGKGTHPLYNLLKDAAPGTLGTRAVKWNFTKFLVGRDGKVLGRLGPMTTPAAIEPQLEVML